MRNITRRKGIMCVRKYRWTSIAVICLIVISGCISLDSSPPKKATGLMPTPTINRPLPIQTPISTPAPVVNQYNTMSFTEFNEAMLSNDFTTLQKENLYADKIFRWDGQVTDVTQDTVIIEIRKHVNYKTDDLTNYYQKYCEYYNNDVKIRQSCLPTKIRLHVSDDQKSQLNSLSKGSIITFEGIITDRYINFLSGIDMSNGKIIEYLLIVIS